MQWSLGQVKEHPLWRGLTDKQRRFFELLEALHLDDAAAAIGAFALQPQSVQVRLNQIRGAWDTGFLYRAMMGFAVPTKEEVIAQLWQLAESTKDEARKYSCLAKIAELLQQKPPREKEKDSETPPAQVETPKVPEKSVPDLSNFRE